MKIFEDSLAHVEAENTPTEALRVVRGNKKEI
jgi:hypothetical protein